MRAQRPHPPMNAAAAGQLDLMESIAAQLPELFREARRQAYEEAICKAVGMGFPDGKANLLLDYCPYLPAREGAA